MSCGPRPCWSTTSPKCSSPTGSRRTQYNVLRILRGAGSGGLCGREVAERMVSRVPDISRLLDRMEEMQLIERERDPADRRHVTARISAKGQKVLKQSTPELEQAEGTRFGRTRARAGQPADRSAGPDPETAVNFF